jgi:hypothetical protein
VRANFIPLVDAKKFLGTALKEIGMDTLFFSTTHEEETCKKDERKERANGHARTNEMIT